MFIRLTKALYYVKNNFNSIVAYIINVLVMPVNDFISKLWPCPNWMFASLLWLLRFFILYSRASSLFYAWFLLFLSIAKQSFKFWSPVYQFFLLQTLLLSANLVCLDFLLCLSYKFYILSPPSIWSHFCIRTCVKNM